MADTFPYKYRPLFLRDFYFDPAIAQSIKGLMRADKLNMLVHGEPNTGKTSLLYAMIREWGEWIGTKVSDKHILFVNNLKEQGITFFRQEIKSFCQMCCSTKKIVVIDDLDIINEQCQQVLCNYMDKYENNIFFLFSCCNVQKVIAGLQSRTFSILLEPSKPKDMEHLYHKIVTQENLLCRFKESEQDQIRDYLIRNANGNLRELINCLGKIMVFIGLDTQYCLDLRTCQGLFLTRIFQSFTEYLQLLRQGRLRESIQIIYSILTKGYSIIDIFDYFFKFVKTEMSMLSETETYEIIKILCSYIHIVHTTHEDNIELVLFTNRLLHTIRGKASAAEAAFGNQGFPFPSGPIL